MTDTQRDAKPDRSRKTSLRVLLSDRIARAVIAIGGIGTIAAVLTVGVYLVWVAVPLFFPSRVGEAEVLTRVESFEPNGMARLGIDEYENLSWLLLPDGSFEISRLDTGDLLERVSPTGDVVPTAFAHHQQASQIAFGFADGTVRLGSIGFQYTFVDLDDAPEALRSLERGQIGADGPSLYQRVNDEQFRVQRFRVELGEPATLSEGHAVRLLDLSVRPLGPILSAFTSDGALHVKVISQRRNMLTGRTTISLLGGQVSLSDEVSGRGEPKALMLTGVADNVFIVWADGQLLRYDIRDATAPSLTEVVDVIPEEGARLATLSFLLGKASIAVGDTKGNIGVWFRVKPDSSPNPDGSDLVRAHFFPGLGSPVTTLGVSHRTRKVVAGFEDGTIALFQVTATRELARASSPGNAPVKLLAMAPKEGSIFGIADASMLRWNIDAAHASITPASIFGRVWYEGYEGPRHVWQSSSGTDDFEPKYGLVPLIFGTIKATVYSLLFGAPLALLAAIYTSEFLNPRTRLRIKPLIEMMASLPSVVLGFLAALVFAPFVENVVPQVLALFLTLPITLLAGAHLVQLLPERMMRSADRARLPLMLLCLPLSVALAMGVGPLFESLFFSGDIKLWLDGQVGNGAGGWLLLLIPLCGVAVAFGSARFVRPLLRAKGGGWSRRRLAVASLGVFVGAVVATLAIAIAISQGLAAVDLDPRGSFVDTYVQRNALVVGFVMGFAIIPIIYTLAEDALSSVPEHLRSASLGAGATPWQTATRVVIPVAMSGLFSALMIGFGRAVGETMIVLMAAGNTPVMDWNIFNGFRTLSANIAVELPEAVRGSTHYRMLFLAALALFVMTFIVNTFAELIRQRFRKRAFQL